MALVVGPRPAASGHSLPLVVLAARDNTGGALVGHWRGPVIDWVAVGRLVAAAVLVAAKLALVVALSRNHLLLTVR